MRAVPQQSPLDGATNSRQPQPPGRLNDAGIDAAITSDWTVRVVMGVHASSSRAPLPPALREKPA